MRSVVGCQKPRSGRSPDLVCGWNAFLEVIRQTDLEHHWQMGLNKWPKYGTWLALFLDSVSVMQRLAGRYLLRKKKKISHDLASSILHVYYTWTLIALSWYNYRCHWDFINTSSNNKLVFSMWNALLIPSAGEIPMMIIFSYLRNGLALVFSGISCCTSEMNVV